MEAIHCQGCERYVERERNERERMIVPVKLEARGFAVGKSPVEADLCLRCLAKLRARFFGVEPDPRTEDQIAHEALLGPPAMPRYLEDELDAIGALP